MKPSFLNLFALATAVVAALNTTYPVTEQSLISPAEELDEFEEWIIKSATIYMGAFGCGVGGFMISCTVAPSFFSTGWTMGNWNDALNCYGSGVGIFSSITGGLMDYYMAFHNHQSTASIEQVYSQSENEMQTIVSKVNKLLDKFGMLSTNDTTPFDKSIEYLVNEKVAKHALLDSTEWEFTFKPRIGSSVKAWNNVVKSGVKLNALRLEEKNWPQHPFCLTTSISQLHFKICPNVENYRVSVDTSKLWPLRQMFSIAKSLFTTQIIKNMINLLINKQSFWFPIYDSNTGQEFLTFVMEWC